MAENFLISGFGRSGTRFLSSIMNKSKKWTVLHEPRGIIDEQKLTNECISDFSYDYYGEVNSRMRFRYYDIRVKKRGLIFRNTKDIIKSVANRKSELKTLELIDEIYYWYNIFNKWIEEDDSIIIIDFDSMVSNIDYLEWILKEFKINDVDLSVVDLNNKINTNKNNKYLSFDFLPKQIKDKYYSYEWNYK